MVAALGLADGLVGRTHECDWPPEVAGVPALTADRVDRSAMTSAEIDGAVADAMAGGGGLYRLDHAALAAARPDLIITQALCGVCAVERDEVEEAARALPGRPEVLSLEPETLDGVLDSILLVGEAAGAPRAAAATVAGLRERLDRVRALVGDRPRCGPSAWSGSTRPTSPATGCPSRSRWRAATTRWAGRAAPRSPRRRSG